MIIITSIYWGLYKYRHPSSPSINSGRRVFLLPPQQPKNREMRYLAQCHTANEWWNLHLNPEPKMHCFFAGNQTLISVQMGPWKDVAWAAVQQCGTKPWPRNRNRKSEGREKRRQGKVLSSCSVLGIMASTFFPIVPTLKIHLNCTEKETQAQRIVQGPQLLEPGLACK